MYKEINLPEVVGALLVDKKTGKVRVDNVLLSEVQKVIVGEDKFMKVDFSRQQYRRVAYLGGGHVKVEESQSVVIEAGFLILMNGSLETINISPCGSQEQNSYLCLRTKAGWSC